MNVFKNLKAEKYCKRDILIMTADFLRNLLAYSYRKIIFAKIGKNVRISRRAKIFGAGKIVIGNNVVIANCSFNPYCVIYGHGGLHVGNDVRVATGAVIIPANHIFEDKNTPITKQGIKTKGISIGNDVWIGANVTILDGVKIGDSTVVGAGAVVTKNAASHCVYAGVPAKLVRER
ncbi:MAG: hypothetical protein UW03_C0015G0022 [Candidatus Peregrinibacteria bacterium GW2011_GWA2_43_8]|nr:MAG: hypothetical protein UW03_C0015G0022 [Candidatus Peregrinibacteria bacterium GW2011_GWA2_43_8]